MSIWNQIKKYYELKQNDVVIHESTSSMFVYLIFRSYIGWHKDFDQTVMVASFEIVLYKVAETISWQTSGPW